MWEDVRRLATDAHRMVLLPTREQLSGDSPPSMLGASASVGHGRLSRLQIDTIMSGSCLDVIRSMPDACIQTVVTSPPYWGVRRYIDDQTTTWADGTTVALGQEKWPEDYVRHTLEILGELRRVLKKDGVVYWNVGDTYMTRSHVRAGSLERLDALEGRRKKESWKDYPVRRYSAGHPYLKDKDLTLVPFQVALGAQRLGWWVRSVIVWSKDNTLPESVKDRPTSSHEYIFMLAQDRFYKYDPIAATEDQVSDWSLEDRPAARRNIRSVWHFGTSVGHGNHVAAFPLALPLRCIRASTAAGDIVFDPFAGSGTTLVAAKMLGRRYVGADISPTYVKLSQDRLARTAVLDASPGPVSIQLELDA